MRLLICVALLNAVAYCLEQQKEDQVEVCQTEVFEASCERSDEVVVVMTSQYGRMRVSRCVQSDYGYIGCSSDVTSVLDATCSGRRQCSVGVPSAELERAAAAACPGDLKLYLAAAYRCLPVIVGDGRPCRQSTTYHITSRHGFISSAVAETTQRGTTQCPWVVDARPGQRVNVTLWDFASPRPASPGSADSADLVQPCQAYAVIRERAPSRSFTVCNQTKRTHLVYTSASETVEIRILPGGLGKDTRNKPFLLEYEIYGCPDAEALSHPGYWFRRRGNRMEVGCTATEDSWSMTCDGFNWVSESHRNCTTAGFAFSEVKEDPAVPWATSFVAVVAIAVVLSGIIVTAGLVILGCHRRSRDSRPPGSKPPGDTYYRSHIKTDHSLANYRAEMIPESQYNAENSRFVEHEYSYIADLQPPISNYGPNFGQTGSSGIGGDGEADEAGQELLGSGPAQQCRPGAECAGPQCRQVLRQRSAVQLVDQSQQNLTVFGSVASLTDTSTIAVRGVAPPSRAPGNVGLPPSAKQIIYPRVSIGSASCVPPVPEYFDSVANRGSQC